MTTEEDIRRDGRDPGVSECEMSDEPSEIEAACARLETGRTECSCPGPGYEWCPYCGDRRTVIAAARAYEAEREARLETALRRLMWVPAVVQVLGSNHTPGCRCPLCEARAALDGETK